MTTTEPTDTTSSTLPSLARFRRGVVARTALAALFAAGLTLAGCGGQKDTSADSDTMADEAPAMADQTQGDAAGGADMMTDQPEDKMVYARLSTTMGNIVLELDKENAPISTQNFVSYAEKGGYDGTIFHRVIDGFMVQGGGLEPDLDKRPTDAPIKNEWQNGLSNTRGTVAMARLSNQPDSATNQFFINVVDNDFLDTPRDGAGYAVFARVVEGMGVVDAIKSVPTTTRAGLRDVPVDPVIIENVSILSADEAQQYISGGAG